jgi:hypothetical protein
MGPQASAHLAVRPHSSAPSTRRLLGRRWARAAWQSAGSATTSSRLLRAMHKVWRAPEPRPLELCSSANLRYPGVERVRGCTGPDPQRGPNQFKRAVFRPSVSLSSKLADRRLWFIQFLSFLTCAAATRPPWLLTSYTMPVQTETHSALHAPNSDCTSPSARANGWVTNGTGAQLRPSLARTPTCCVLRRGVLRALNGKATLLPGDTRSSKLRKSLVRSAQCAHAAPCGPPRTVLTPA